MRPSAIITGAGSYYGGPAANTRAKTMQPLVAQKELGEMLFYEPSPEPDVEKYVARPADRRAMGLQFQWGAAAAGKALEQAGYTSREERENVALFVASRAGERDHDVDAAAVEELPA